MRIAVIADIHHYSEKLGTDGRAYELRAGNDQKCLKETGAILDAAFRRFKREDLDAVLVAGDITNDGERVSHDEVYDKLADLQTAVPVYLTTATHDWCCDGNARRFTGDKAIPEPDTLTPTELRERYRRFGADKILSEYRTHLDKASYCYALSPTLRLLALDDDQDGKGHSGYSDAHFQWILDRIRDAGDEGARIFAVQHHLLLGNLCPLVNRGQLIGDNVARADALADAGLRLIFVGHSHTQRTSEHRSPKGNPLTQINVGSLCGYPAPIDYLNIEGDTAEITVQKLLSFTYKGLERGEEYLKEQTAGVLLKLLRAAAADRGDFDERLRANGILIKPLRAVYPLVRTGAKAMQSATVGKAARAVNLLTFGKGIDRQAAKAVATDRLIDCVVAIFLCVFDGSESAKRLPEAAKTVARDVIALPGRVLRRLPLPQKKLRGVYQITDQLEGLLDELLHPKRNHMYTEVTL